MKKLLYISILTLTIISCETFEEEPNNKAIESDRFKDLKNENNFEIINLDSLNNFKDLNSKMGELACLNKKSGIKFSYEKRDYYLTAFSECPTSMEVACYFRINDISIKNDSISSISFDKVKLPIEDLGEQLSKIISNPYNYEFNKDIMKPALIHLYIDEKRSINTTKKVLKEIIDQFEKLNSTKTPDFFKYQILIEGFDRANIPPPPPPPEMK